MKFSSQKGSILLSTLAFVILLSVAAASILELTMNSYKLTMRNELRVKARIVGESELETMYFKAFALLLADQPPDVIPALLPTIADVSVLGDIIPTTPQTPFLPEHGPLGENWRVMRSISYWQPYDYFTGMIPGTTKHGNVTYLTCKVLVQPPVGSFFANAVTVKVGRRFQVQKSSIFQYNVFFQGDMELQPAGAIEIKGDIAANGSIYAAANGATSSLTFDGKLRYLATGYFDQDSTGATVLRKPGTPVSGGILLPPLFAIGQAQQVETLSAPENLLGGVDAVELQARRPDLFHDVNDVYRAAILPPPGQTDEYPAVSDDPTIGAQRMYNRADLRVVVDGATNLVQVYKSDGTDVTANFPAIIVGGAPSGGSITGGNIPLHDSREGVDVGVTTIDMGALKSAIELYYPTGSNDFNGSIYFNLKNSSSSAPKAIRLQNATKVFARSGKGLTVATNGGVYVQGDYNTITDISGSDAVNYTGPDAAHKNSTIVPAMIMGDQVTVLSQGWLDTNAVLDKWHRVATGNISIQAGILTGNTPASTTVASGGAQNLVRFEEQWAGKTVEYFGSIGRLFDSKTFIAAWQQPGLFDVYGSPASRTYIFDTNLRDNPPAGSPTTTAFLRGTFFVWL